MKGFDEHDYHSARCRFKKLIDEGLEDMKNGDTMPFEDAMAELRERIAKR